MGGRLRWISMMGLFRLVGMILPRGGIKVLAGRGTVRRHLRLQSGLGEDALRFGMALRGWTWIGRDLHLSVNLLVLNHLFALNLEEQDVVEILHLLVARTTYLSRRIGMLVINRKCHRLKWTRLLWSDLLRMGIGNLGWTGHGSRFRLGRKALVGPLLLLEMSLLGRLSLTGRPGGLLHRRLIDV